MSDSIQSISQGNYILHNIDAKKLYVQEPLFTANSGDAVYVGWRPDETVLWSGTRFTTGYRDLNESFLNFEQIRFKLCTEDQDNWQCMLYPCQTTAQYFNASISQIWPGTYTASWIKNGLWRPTSETRISGLYQSLQRITTAGISNNITTTGEWLGIYEIVGINRKENA